MTVARYAESERKQAKGYGLDLRAYTTLRSKTIRERYNIGIKYEELPKGYYSTFAYVLKHGIESWIKRKVR